MEITTETIKQNYPAIWWQIYRAGFSAAVNDPNQQERAAKKHMEQALTKASPAAQRPQAVTITAEQATINAQLGLSDEDFHTFAHAGQRGAL